MRRAARRRPWAGVAWWKTSRTCWAQWSATSTLIVRLICREGLTESLLLPLREPMTRGAQEKPDVVEGIPLASTVAQCVLPGATAYLTWGITGECDDVKGAWHAGCLLELVVNGVLAVPGRDQASRFAPPTEVFSALGQPVLVHGARPARHQVQQAGRGMILPASGPAMPVSSRGPRGVGLGGATRAHRLPMPEPLRNGRGHQMRLAGTA